MTDLLTQKNTVLVNFQPKKIRRTPRHVYFEYPPGLLTAWLTLVSLFMLALTCAYERTKGFKTNNWQEKVSFLVYYGRPGAFVAEENLIC